MVSGLAMVMAAVAAKLAPLLLLAGGGEDGAAIVHRPGGQPTRLVQRVSAEARPAGATSPVFDPQTVAMPEESNQQVRIEQRMQIRIIARPSPTFLDRLFGRDEPGKLRVKERKVGKCLLATQIGGMTPQSDRQLLLQLRDRRMISATLERACHARDFYSGFYMARSSDGQLCAERDNLLSRSGMRCKIKQFRELVLRAD